MKDFQFKMLTKIVFGKGKAGEIGALCKAEGAHKALIVAGPVVGKLPVTRSVTEGLKREGISFKIFSDAVVDPPIEVVDRAARQAVDNGADILIAIGGGSSMDTAKAISLLMTNGGSIRDYLFGGSRTVSDLPVPLICVPTTAGSGSEVTAAAVITDTENRMKLSVTDEKLLPRYAVIDPNAQLEMPPSVTAPTGLDALTHAIESYVSLNAEPVSDAFALQAIRLISRYLRTAVADGSNEEARANMALASTMAAAAYMNGGLGVVHGIAQAMGGVAHTPHGISNAVILPYAMKRNVTGNLEKFREIAVAMGEKVEGLSLRDAAQKAVDAVSLLNHDLKIPRKISELGITRDMFPEILKGTMEYRLLAVNPVKLGEKDVLEILEESF